ncbi:TolC family protein [Sulfurimonas paralvinellae]|uniref:TolC family protein n=1 Tax=Sulfurimonas paralvinellae TaxID=317658 RepID=A0A7M1B723_9BACT|nr:TolC family protein [Sulfurimonas paralvinellae]QOP45480.1 TolC family protein [Sulfurimonas paralvinellae]
MKKFLLLLFFCTSVVNAEVLTLQESIDKVLQNYPDVKTFELKIKQSESSYRSAFADYLPQVEVQGEYDATGTYVLPQNGSFHTVDDSGWNAGVNLKQKIWDFSKTSSKVNASKVDKDISQLSLKELKALLVYKVKSLYELMVVQSEAIEVRKKDLESKEAYYEQARALVKQGLKTEADANRFLSAVYLAKDNLAIAQTSYEKAKATLSLYMDEKIPQNITLEREFLKREFHSPANLQKDILQSNYSLQIDEQNIKKNILLHKSAQASHYGSIDAIASYNHIDTLNVYDTKLAGVTLSIPLYSGGRVSAEAQKAQISAQIAAEQKRSRELALKEELNNLLFDIERYNNTVAARKAQLTSAQSTKNVLDARYKEGLATYIEVLDATSQVLNARLSLLETYYSRALSMDRIDYLQGKIDE